MPSPPPNPENLEPLGNPFSVSDTVSPPAFSPPASSEIIDSRRDVVVRRVCRSEEIGRRTDGRHPLRDPGARRAAHRGGGSAARAADGRDGGAEAAVGLRLIRVGPQRSLVTLLLHGLLHGLLLYRRLLLYLRRLLYLRLLYLRLLCRRLLREVRLG